MEDAPPASLALWEQYLVYGIALGVAEDVLAAARLHAPPEVVEDSGWFPVDSGDVDGDVFEDIQDIFSGAFTPPSSGSSDSGSYDSGSSGSGGSFSGGGGDGGGGGGTGAW